MGKYLTIKGADFSKVAVDSTTPSSKIYIYGYIDEDFENMKNKWVVNTLGYGDLNNDLVGKTIKGIRANVASAGTMNVYKLTDYSQPTVLTQVATLTATETGIQDIEFSSPITVNEDEYIIFAKNGETPTLSIYYSIAKDKGFLQFCGSSKMSISKLYWLGLDYFY